MPIKGFLSRISDVLDMAISSSLIPLLKFFNRDGEGIEILKKDWDILVILDACRCDVFRVVVKRFGFEGEITCVKSKGSSTSEFLEKNFLGTPPKLLKKK